MSYYTYDRAHGSNHAHDDGTVGTILTWNCKQCGCGYYYCDICNASQEFAEPQASCTDTQCGCHTDPLEELGWMMIEYSKEQLLRMLEDLTPGGSEFCGSPQRCFDWAQKEISDRLRMTVAAYIARNEAIRERDKALAELARLRAEMSFQAGMD
jgi:hypothetical protein